MQQPNSNSAHWMFALRLLVAVGASLLTLAMTLPGISRSDDWVIPMWLIFIGLPLLLIVVGGLLRHGMEQYGWILLLLHLLLRLAT